MGMVAYDALSLDKSMSRHRMLNRGEALNASRASAAEGLRGAAAYYDAQAEYPERLSVENALAARRLGAVVLPYMSGDRAAARAGRTGHRRRAPRRAARRRATSPTAR